jgi:hypothetical protein
MESDGAVCVLCTLFCVQTLSRLASGLSSGDNTLFEYIVRTLRQMRENQPITIGDLNLEVLPLSLVAALTQSNIEIQPFRKVHRLIYAIVFSLDD